MDEIMVQLPLQLTSSDLRAIREDGLCECSDKDEMYKRLGWFICAYDAVVAKRQKEQTNDA